MDEALANKWPRARRLSRATAVLTFTIEPDAGFGSYYGQNRWREGARPPRCPDGRPRNIDARLRASEGS